MKLTFQPTTKPAFGPCAQCQREIAAGATWFYNWRPSAVVKVLCEPCYGKRLIQHDWARDLAEPLASDREQ